MNFRDFTAMVSLLDDSDNEVVEMVQHKLKSLGTDILLPLEKEKEFYIDRPKIISKIDELISEIHIGNLSLDFAEWKTSGAVDLLTGLWLISKIENPTLKLEDLHSEINQIYLDIWVATHREMHPVDLLRILNTTFFNEWKFEPNEAEFHHPYNSLFDKVLQLRKGNPISLSCVYILLGEKLNVPIYGVNLPNLFVILFDYPNYRFYVNVFKKGQIFHSANIDEYLDSLGIERKSEFYERASNFTIIIRFLNNLAYAYKKNGDAIRENYVHQILSILS